MFSNQSKNTVVHLIKDVVIGEKELESIKQSLILHLTDYNISYQTCFLNLSYDKDRITQNDLETFLQNYQIRYDQREIIMFRYSSYQDFLDIMLPSNQIFLKQYQQKQMNYNIPNEETLILLSKIFCKNIQIIRQTQAYLDALIIRFDRTTLLNYLCPKTEKKYPTFLQLLKNLDLDISFEDVVCAMRRLDKDQDTDVDKFDWEELIKVTKPPTNTNSKIPKSIQKQQSSKSIQKQQSSKSFSKQQSSKSINRSEQRQYTDQENNSSLRNVQFSQNKSSTQSLKKKASFQMDESVLEFQLHLLTIGKINDEIDEIKLELSSRGDYTLNQAFEFFDLDTDNTIGQQDLKLGFLQLGIDTNEYQIKQLLYYYSTHHTKTQLDLTDFQELFPESKQYQSSGKLGNFSYETKKLIKQIMLKYLDLIRYKKESTQQLGKDRKNIDLIFNFIDLDQDGLIIQDDFKVLDIKMKHVMLFFKSFQDYKITYNQFIKYFG